jgi:hypothetical protein
MAEAREAKRTRLSAVPDALQDSAPRTLAEAVSAVRQVHRIGGRLPPRVQGSGVLGEVQVYVPYVSFRRHKGPESEAPPPPPQRVQVGADVIGLIESHCAPGMSR